VNEGCCKGVEDGCCKGCESGVVHSAGVNEPGNAYVEGWLLTDGIQPEAGDCGCDALAGMPM
jgi:hypothetical protein